MELIFQGTQLLVGMYQAVFDPSPFQISYLICQDGMLYL